MFQDRKQSKPSKLLLSGLEGPTAMSSCEASCIKKHVIKCQQKSRATSLPSIFINKPKAIDPTTACYHSLLGKEHDLQSCVNLREEQILLIKWGNRFPLLCRRNGWHYFIMITTCDTSFSSRCFWGTIVAFRSGNTPAHLSPSSYSDQQHWKARNRPNSPYLWTLEAKSTI